MVDTGSHKTLVNITAIDVNNNTFGILKPYRHNVYTAEGKKANILGTKICQIRIGQNWTCSMEILLAKNLIKPCIMGMDFLTMCPITNNILNTLRININKQSNELRLMRNSNTTPFNNDHSFNSVETIQISTKTSSR